MFYKIKNFKCKKNNCSARSNWVAAPVTPSYSRAIMTPSHFDITLLQWSHLHSTGLTGGTQTPHWLCVSSWTGHRHAANFTRNLYCDSTTRASPIHDPRPNSPLGAEPILICRYHLHLPILIRLHSITHFPICL